MNKRVKILTPEDFGLWIYNEMKNKGTKQADLAKKIGLTEAAVCYYIKAKRFPRMNVLTRMLNKMGKHIEIVDD